MNRILWTALGLLLPFGLALPVAAQKHDHEHEPAPAKEAVCVLVSTSGSHVSGVLTLTQEKDYVLVKGEVSGLKAGLHGFHIHTFGDLRTKEGKNDGAMAGGHYAPTDTSMAVRIARSTMPATWATSRPARTAWPTWTSKRTTCICTSSSAARSSCTPTRTI